MCSGWLTGGRYPRGSEGRHDDARGARPRRPRILPARAPRRRPRVRGARRGPDRVVSGERLVRNPLAGPLEPDPGAPPSLAFHRALPGYRPTPLVEAPRAAEALGVERVLVKDESGRLGLPSFKVLGASWATYRALC